MSYFLYILRCSDDTLYTGITTDLNRRLDEHNGKDILSSNVKKGKGAKYTRARRPVELVYKEVFNSRGEASRAEANIKKMSRSEKQKLFI